MSNGTKIYLHQPHGELYGLAIMSMDSNVINNFRILCYTNLPKHLNWFHQGTSEHWELFEFWNNNQSVILDSSMKIAEMLHLELELEAPTREWLMENKYIN